MWHLAAARKFQRNLQFMALALGCLLALVWIGAAKNLATKVVLDSQGQVLQQEARATSQDAAADDGDKVVSYRSLSRHDLAQLREKSKTAKRGRFGFFLHQDYEGTPSFSGPASQWSDGCSVQTFFNVLSRGSYVMPHMHPQKGKWEVFAHMDKDLKIAAFDHSIQADDLSNLAETVILSDEVPLVVVSEGTFHSIAALTDEGAAEFEFKPGPYLGMPADKIMSHQLAAPWGFDEKTQGIQDTLASYTKKLELATGYQASDPVSQAASYSRLAPYTRQWLLDLLNRKERHHRLFSDNNTKGGPLVTVLSLPGIAEGNTPVQVRPSRTGGKWSTYVWLAGGAAQVGGYDGPLVGPTAPLLEAWGSQRTAALYEGLAAVGKEGAILLEVSQLS
eukprot:TRINITY_DN56411_c0_g1_i1.p1 TRINITY_DN56411_c0_g1~~TRINITY_DN56411_c0_g1_i1.p1  ORF type:complete len:391 (+),score=40.63 TRINITY_DN56411_c0_g1_i1:45-1217(+)